MLRLATETVRAFEARMAQRGIPIGERAAYLKWVRFYLDFCQKYGLPPREVTSIPAFLAKLLEKRQDGAQQEQATQAVHLLLEHSDRKPKQTKEERSDQPPNTIRRAAATLEPQTCEEIALLDQRNRQPGCSWFGEYQELEAAVKMRNYSGRTLDAYLHWTRRFQSFVQSRTPSTLNGGDVKAFLSSLAVEQGVAASTQNQAFNAILFLFRHVLRKELGQLDGVVRAKRRPYVPVVLSKSEVEQVLANLAPPFQLVVSLLYGCGLRISECLELRVHCLNLDSMLLTVHDGKGQKDRTVPLPAKLQSEISEQLESVKHLHEEDLARGYAGVFLPKQLERKYKSAPKQFIWQWLFPAANLTLVQETDERRRYHLHAGHVQAAVRQAAGQTGILKRISPHTFRHTFASHLLLAGYDLPTIQRLLGHGDIKTTMIYLQTVPSITLKEARSPMDL